MGRGSFGTVYEGRWRSLRVAVKLFNKDLADNQVHCPPYRV